MLVAVGVACVCATALFVVCVGGGIWINHLKDQTMQGNSDTEGGTDSTEKKSESGFEVRKNPISFVVFSKSKIQGFFVPFNSQGHIATGPQHCHLWESNPHKGDCLWLDSKPANPLVH